MKYHLLNINTLRQFTVLWAGYLFLIYAQAVFGEPRLSDDEQGFLNKHWPLSIGAQGTPPDNYSNLEASLAPESCGTCHVTQYRDWKSSLHGNAMGPGVLGQVIEMEENDPETAKLCLTCHAPLLEQQRKISTESTAANAQHINNPLFSQKLQHQSLVCASCHVRKHQRFGPPRKNTPQVSGEIRDEELPHGGFATQTAFSKSAFCKTCHQFKPEGYALNGKLIENTYNEWAASDYSGKGIECQSCHMPGRKHQWRGIHDQQMVRNGVDIELVVADKKLAFDDEFTAEIKIINSRVGHYFPTYITPKVFVRGYFLDRNGQIIDETHLEAAIGRETNMNLSEEIYDTRIAPGETLSVLYSQALTSDSTTFKVEIIVEPDHFYERFYQSILSGGVSGKARKMMQAALTNTQNSPFSIFEKEINLENYSKPGLRPSKTKNDKTVINSSSSLEHTLDWNESEITWLSYQQGKKLSTKTSKPMLLIFYADWCPTCHAYKKVFYDPKIVKAAKGFVMARVNIDKNPELSDRYNLDGGYVPRTFLVDDAGNIMKSKISNNATFKYFVRNDINRFLKIMQPANKGQL